MESFNLRCPCSATPFSCALLRVGPGRLQAVVVEYLLVALVEVAALAVLQLVRRSRQVVAPDHLRRCTQLPQRSLKAAPQRRERCSYTCQAAFSSIWLGFWMAE